MLPMIALATPILFISIIAYVKNPEILNTNQFFVAIKKANKDQKPLPDKVKQFNKHGYWIICFGTSLVVFLLGLGSFFTIRYSYAPMVISDICITVPCLINIIVGIIYMIGYIAYNVWIRKHVIVSSNDNESMSSEQIQWLR